MGNPRVIAPNITGEAKNVICSSRDSNQQLTIRAVNILRKPQQLGSSSPQSGQASQNERKAFQSPKETMAQRAVLEALASASGDPTVAQAQNYALTINTKSHFIYGWDELNS